MNMSATAAAKIAPKTRDAATTRERILTVAMKEFVARGFDGARVDAIVLKSKISKNLLYHYFESKEALFIEVMERAYAAMRRRQDELVSTDDDPVTEMRRMVELTIQHFVDQPSLISLLATENLHKAKHIKQSEVIETMFNPLRSTLSDLLVHGQEKGLFRLDVDWVDLYVSISGLGSYAISNRHTLSYVLGIDIATAERMRKRIEHAANMVMSYLCDVKERPAAELAKGGH